MTLSDVEQYSSWTRGLKVVQGTSVVSEISAKHIGRWTLSRFSIFARSSGILYGLDRISSIPLSLAAWTCSTLTFAVTAITGTRVQTILLACFVVSNSSNTGQSVHLWHLQIH